MDIKYNAVSKAKVELLTELKELKRENSVLKTMYNNDIIELKKAQEKLKLSEKTYRGMLNGVSELIYIQDEEGKFLDVNDAVVKAYGYKREYFIGKTPEFLSAPGMNDMGHISQAISSAFKGNSQCFEFWGMTKEGRVFPKEVCVSKGNYFNQKVIIAVARDITERKLAEKELAIYRNNLEELVKQRTEELDRLNKALKGEIEREKEFELILKNNLEKEKELSEMKSSFISTTSHEFRTPLTSILSSTELIQRFGAKWDDEKKNEHFSRIKKSVEYLTKLLDDVLIISRAENGKISCKPEPVDLLAFAKECTEDAKSIIKPTHKMELNYNLKENQFQLDPKLIRFIMSNLLSNAAKYSPDGGKIGLNIFNDVNHLCIEVSDNGIGIAPEDIGNIYQSFYRTKSASGIAGTGLGLAIVKRAVDLHQGEISVTSELSKGTTFMVKIPKILC